MHQIFRTSPKICERRRRTFEGVLEKNVKKYSFFIFCGICYTRGDRLGQKYVNRGF